MPKVLDITVPEDSDGLREVLTNRSSLRVLLGDPDGFVDFVNKYSKTFAQRDPDIKHQINSQTEAFLVDWLQRNESKITASEAKRTMFGNARVHKGSAYNSTAIGAQFDNSFNSTSELFTAVQKKQLASPSMAESLSRMQNAASSLKPSDGGFLIPETFRAEMLRVALESSVVRSRARVVPMDSLTLAFPAVDATSNATSVYGGIAGGWTEEGATLTASQPSFSRVGLRAYKLCLYVDVPNELIADSKPAFNTFMQEVFPEAYAWFEDVAFTVGGGVGEPLGYLQAPCAVAPTRSTTVAGNNVEWVDIVNMYARFLPSSMGRGVWTISQDVLPSLLTMEVSSGSGAVMLGGGSFPSGASLPPMSMLGMPIVVSEKCSTVGTIGDINLCDFGYYLIGDRQAMTMRESSDYKFAEDLTSFRVIGRVDGRPWLQSAITPQNGSENTLSPFVQLTTAP